MGYTIPRKIRIPKKVPGIKSPQSSGFGNPQGRVIEIKGVRRNRVAANDHTSQIKKKSPIPGDKNPKIFKIPNEFWKISDPRKYKSRDFQKFPIPGIKIRRF